MKSNHIPPAKVINADYYYFSETTPISCYLDFGTIFNFIISYAYNLCFIKVQDQTLPSVEIEKNHNCLPTY